METLTDGPPRRTEPPPPPPPRSSASKEDRGEWRRRDERRRLAIGLVVSVVVHLLVIAVASRLLVGPGATVPVPSPTTPVGAPEPEQMQAVDLIEVAAADASEPDAAPDEPDPEPEPEPEPTEAAEPTTEAEEDAAVADEAVADEPMSPADRLRPRMGDPRLWAAPSDLAPGEEPTEMDRVRERIAGKVGVLNDSMAAALEAERRSREWIVEDDDGGRWGVSPGAGGMPQLHLGDITIPLPVGFPMSPELQERMAEWNAIRAQVGRQTVDDYLDERAKAIRERIDRERGQDADSGGGGGDGGDGGGSGGSGGSGG